MQNYNFAPVGPFCFKPRAVLVAEKYGGKVVEKHTMFGNGFYIVPLDYEV